MKLYKLTATYEKNSYLKVVLVLAALAGLIILGWLILPKKKPGTAEVATRAKQTEARPENALSPEAANIPQAVEAPEAKISEKFLTEIPHYGQTEKIEAYTLKYPNSNQLQDVYRFYSLKTMAENLAYYTGWAKENGWTVVNTVKEKEALSLYLAKDGEILVMKTIKNNDKVKVSLDLLRQAAE